MRNPTEGEYQPTRRGRRDVLFRYKGASAHVSFLTLVNTRMSTSPEGHEEACARIAAPAATRTSRSFQPSPLSSSCLCCRHHPEGSTSERRDGNRTRTVSEFRIGRSVSCRSMKSCMTSCFRMKCSNTSSQTLGPPVIFVFLSAFIIISPKYYMAHNHFRPHHFLLTYYNFCLQDVSIGRISTNRGQLHLLIIRDAALPVTSHTTSWPLFKNDIGLSKKYD